MRVRFYMILMVIFAGLSVLILSGCSDGDGFSLPGQSMDVPIPELISSTSVESSDSSTDGEWVAWCAKTDSGSTTRIFVQDVEETLGPEAISPDVGFISGGNSLWDVVVQDNLVVWRAWDGAAYRIYAYDLALASPTVVDISGIAEAVDVFHTRGRVVVWVGNNNMLHIYRFDTGESISIPVVISSSVPYPNTDGRFVTWMAGNWPVFDIYVYDLDAAAPAPIKLTGGGWNAHPEVDEGVVVWYGGGGGDADEVYYADANLATPVVVRITNNGVADDYPKISDGVIVWAASEGVDSEIYYYDVMAASPSIVKVTNNSTHDGQWPSIPRIDNGLIVWAGEVSGVSENEIFYYDLNASTSNVVRLTNNTLSDTKPRVTLGMITWIANGNTYVARQ